MSEAEAIEAEYWRLEQEQERMMEYANMLTAQLREEREMQERLGVGYEPRAAVQVVRVEGGEDEDDDDEGDILPAAPRR